MNPGTLPLLVLFSAAVASSSSASSSPSPSGLAASAGDRAAAQALGALAQQLDRLHTRRDDRGSLAEERRLVEATLAGKQGSFPILWRASRLYFWLSDDPSQTYAERSRLGKIGWDLGEQAIAANPDDPAGYYWAAVNMGNYVLGLGAWKALTAGLEDKFRDRLARAEQLAPDYEHGSVGVAWGRFFEKLPWPKRDRKRAMERFRGVLERDNPFSLRARVYLADTLAEDGRPAEAKQLLDEVGAAVPGRYDPPEERRAKALAEGLLARVLRELH